MSRNIVDEQKAEAVKSVFESDLDDLIEDAVKVVCQYDRASASLIQRRLAIGYARAARIIDQLEALGVIRSSEGSEPREVLIKNPEEVKHIKRKDEKIYEEPELKYKAPKLSVINKPKQTPWKYSLSDITKKLGENEARTFPLGFDESRKLILGDLKELGSLIITGNIWSNKEVFLDTLLTSLIVKNSPRAIRLVLIDESRYLNYYDNLQHLLSPVIYSLDKAISAIRWAISEESRRLKLLSEWNMRNVEDSVMGDYELFPDILVVINQVENLFNVYKDETVSGIKQLTMNGQRAGIHLVLTTNRLTVKEIPAEIQSDIPNRVFFRLTTKQDVGSSNISGVDKLEAGEAIYLKEGTQTKLNTIFTSEENVKDVVKEIVSQK
jgi:DNA segregation ATPase FtsK/SpoIIIE-like protein